MISKRILRLSQPLSRSSISPFVPPQSRALSSTIPHRAATHDDHHGGHESHYNPPGGWLWGERPDEKYEKEGWENLFYWGFCGSWVVAIIAYTMKEDTSIQTWALEEARRRLEKEGILDDTNSSDK